MTRLRSQVEVTTNTLGVRTRTTSTRKERSLENGDRTHHERRTRRRAGIAGCQDTRALVTESVRAPLRDVTMNRPSELMGFCM